MAGFHWTIALLHGSSTWVLSSRTLTQFASWHYCCATWISHNHIQHHPDGTWEYPSPISVLDECNLQSILTSYTKRWNTQTRTHRRQNKGRKKKTLIRQEKNLATNTTATVIQSIIPWSREKEKVKLTIEIITYYVYSIQLNFWLVYSLVFWRSTKCVPCTTPWIHYCFISFFFSFQRNSMKWKLE